MSRAFIIIVFFYGFVNCLFARGAKRLHNKTSSPFLGGARFDLPPRAEKNGAGGALLKRLRTLRGGADKKNEKNRSFFRGERGFLKKQGRNARKFTLFFLKKFATPLFFVGGEQRPRFLGGALHPRQSLSVSYFLPRGVTLEGEGEAARPAPHTLEVLKREKMYFFYF